MAVDPLDLGPSDGPPIDEKPYKIVFDANGCIGAGQCAVVSGNWQLDLDTGLAVPQTYFISETELAENVQAADACPAKQGRGVIHVIDRRTGEEVAPNPEGDGTFSADW